MGEKEDRGRLEGERKGGKETKEIAINSFDSYRQEYKKYDTRKMSLPLPPQMDETLVSYIKYIHV